MSGSDDERFLLDEELEAAFQHDLALWRTIQDRADYLAEPAHDVDGQLRDMEDLIYEGLIYRRLRYHLGLLRQRPYLRRSLARHSI